MSDEAAAALQARASEIWSGLEDADPAQLAVRTGARFSPAGRRVSRAGALRLAVWRRDAVIDVPGFGISWADGDGDVDPATAALLAYYFERSDGSPETGRWIAFNELPDGMFYAQAFQGYTGNELARVFGNDGAAFGSAAEELGGVPVGLADLTYSFRALPLVSVAIASWHGDEDFPPSYRVLFDAGIERHLPTDVGAILGSTLTRMLLATSPRTGP